MVMVNLENSEPYMTLMDFLATWKDNNNEFYTERSKNFMATIENSTSKLHATHRELVISILIKLVLYSKDARNPTCE